MNDELSELLAEIHGKPHFAWWPVRMRTANGLLPDGSAWLTWVVRKRCIGFPTYYYARKC